MKTIKLIASLLILLIGCLSCTKEEEPKPIPNRTLLVYLIANNSLDRYSYLDIEEMISGVTEENLNGGNLIILHAPRNAEPELLQIKTENGITNKFHIKDYIGLNPINPNDMRQVMQDVVSLYPAKSYGLILWSHGTAWLPADYQKMSKAFGQDGSNWMEIDELAQGLPDNLFEFILFDACYMASFECVYELRHKANYILASPTEIMGEGYPYVQMIPQMFEDNLRLDLIGKTFYDYYNQKSGDYKTATISLTQTSGLEKLAAIVREILASKEENDLFTVDLSQMQRLEFLPNSPGMLYDCQDFIRQLATEEQFTRFTQAFNQVILYEAHTAKAYFAHLSYSYPIKHCCGLNMYVPQKNQQAIFNWYKDRISWYKAVYP
ncbi:MAG: clostripain-related cysteine peptidase [Parabacteroides sp.]|nr:clostripain-related cysteine peptidase [Parabacteroides sp.]